MKLAQHFEQLGGQEGHDRKEETQGEKESNKGEYSHTVEDIGKYRAQAQQNSIEAIRSAEERYAKAKEEVLSNKNDVKQSADQPQGVPKETGKARGGEAEKGGDVEGVARNAGQETSEKAGQGVKEAGEETSGIVSVGKTIIDYTKQTAEQAAHMAVEAKDVVVTKAGTAVHHAGGKAGQAKDTTIGVGKSATGTTAEAGKGAAGYVVNKAAQAKDVALETGLRAAHYTLKKVVEATEATADAGRKVVDATEEKAEVTKEEKFQKEQEAQEHEAKMRMEVEGEKGPDAKEQAEQGGSLLGTVGETLVDIGKTAKGLVTGQVPEQKDI
ncbi:hypothetical protein AQUCO_05500055v1 [Aquilegia coerulea]|uniref:Uncharacterized protein n=1 Tax=Aquilegia coerulea TaxID=218851 RepID=A0A2G5CGZ4_AQUCA|nr:hypothetical protein AQUCO_05500055v1 [Aquilegia coerulea]